MNRFLLLLYLFREQQPGGFMVFFLILNVGVLVSEMVNNGQTVEQWLDSALRISSSTLDHLILYDTLHHEEETRF